MLVGHLSQALDTLRPDMSKRGSPMGLPTYLMGLLLSLDQSRGILLYQSYTEAKDGKKGMTHCHINKDKGIAQV